MSCLDYSLNRCTAWARYFDDDYMPLDKNWMENQIRPISSARINLLFACSLRVRECAAAVMSLVHSVMLNGHEPYSYLRDALERQPTMEASRTGFPLPPRWGPAITASRLTQSPRQDELAASIHAIVHRLSTGPPEDLYCGSQEFVE